MAGNFFAIGKDEWAAACKLGLNPAVAFLVLARGTGPDNVTTKWSAESIHEHTGISWRRSKEAILELEKAGLAQNVTEQGARKHPTRKIALPDELEMMLWLPNSLIDDSSATSPIARLRQTQNIDWLRAFIELYGEQDLAGDGGLPRTLVRRLFSRTHIGDVGQFRLYGFTREGSYCDDSKIGPLRLFNAKEKPKEGWPAWQFLGALERLGLLEVVDYLAEGEAYESELLHALSGDFEAELLAATIANTIDSLPDWFSHDAERKAYHYVLPVLRDFPTPTVVGVYRLTHRPHTKLTAAWYAKHMEACEHFTGVYRAIAAGDFKGAIAA